MSYADNYAANVANILLRKGDAQAQARLQSGQGWAQALNQIGQSVAQLPQQMQQQKAQAQEAEMRQAQLDGVKAGQQRASILADAYKSSLLPDGMVDRQKLTAAIGATPFADALPDILKGLDQAEAANLSVKEAKKAAETAELGYAKILGEQILASNFNPEIVNGLLTMAEAQGHDVKTYQGLWDKKPDEFKSFVTQLVRPQAPAQPYTLNPGDQRRGANNEVLAENPKPEPVEKLTFGAPTPAMLGGKRVFIRTGSDGQTYDMRGQVVSAPPTPIEPERAPRDERLVQIMGPGGTPIWVRESQAVNQPAAQAPRAVTGAERQALSFFNRAQDAVATIKPLEAEVAKMGLAGQTKLQYAPNWAQSELGQQYRQAQRAFTEARLRKESGAAIPNTEFENDAKTYFAQPGDTAATIAQKAQKRDKLLEGLGYSAGKAYEEFYGEPMKKMGAGGAPKISPPAGWVIK